MKKTKRNPALKGEVKTQFRPVVQQAKTQNVSSATAQAKTHMVSQVIPKAKTHILSSAIPKADVTSKNYIRNIALDARICRRSEILEVNSIYILPAGQKAEKIDNHQVYRKLLWELKRSHHLFVSEVDYVAPIEIEDTGIEEKVPEKIEPEPEKMDVDEEVIEEDGHEKINIDEPEPENMDVDAEDIEEMDFKEDGPKNMELDETEHEAPMLL